MDRSVAEAQQNQNQNQSRVPRNSNDSRSSGVQPARPAVFKGPKRKRLVKACDPCHKSKRRCDGTAPCSNCFFASKECTYTDSSGRPVPAPNALRPDALPQGNTTTHSPMSINSSAPAPSSGSNQDPEPARLLSGTQKPDVLVSASPDTAGPPVFVAANRRSSRSQFENVPQPHDLHLELPRDLLPPRKRFKSDPELSGCATYKRMDGTDTSNGFQRHITHELINLFFAHCHPHRLIIHSASFHADFCRGRIPDYLLNAICAVAAPLSQSPIIRVVPVRHSGERFADAALAGLFDAEGRLVETGLEAAQALALVQTYNVYKESNMLSDLRFYDLALRILHTMHMRDTDPNVADTTSLSADQLHARNIQRESARRTFWLIHMVELLGAVFTQRPTMYNKDDLAGVRLPSDEASFDLALQVLPERAEYLDSPPLKTRDTSEFGHVIRIATILLDIERLSVSPLEQRMLSGCEEQLERWVLSLADHLKYSPANLLAHLSLWETGSNTSTWCYCFMHILHACAVLALSSIRRRLGQEVCRDYESALQAFPAIIKALGPRARNSILMGSVLWMHYCGPYAARHSGSGTDLTDGLADESTVPVNVREGTPASPVEQAFLPELDSWVKEWEEFWGPATMHGNGHALEAHRGERRSAYQPVHPTTVSVPRIETSNTEEHEPSSTASAPSVPDVVIDSAFRPGDEHDSSPTLQLSPALSTTSTLRSRNQPSLPSLKSSGLLDVLPDESLGSRSSGASTPTKVPHPWQLGSGSPRPPLLSPGLPISVGSSSAGSVPVSPQPHSPGLRALHAPQARLQVPSFYQSSSPLPSPGIVAPSLYEDAAIHQSRGSDGSH